MKQTGNHKQANPDQNQQNCQITTICSDVENNVEIKPSEMPFTGQIEKDGEQSAAGFKNKRNQKAQRKQQQQKQMEAEKTSPQNQNQEGLANSFKKQSQQMVQRSNDSKQAIQSPAQIQSLKVSEPSLKQSTTGGKIGQNNESGRLESDVEVQKSGQKVVLRKSNLMDNLDKIDGACEYFQVLVKENQDILEEIQAQKLNEANEHSSNVSKELNELPKGYPQKHMFKPPKIDKEKFQIEVEQEVYRGNKEMYNIEEIQVYSNQKHDTTLNIRERRNKRSNSVQVNTLQFHEKRNENDKHQAKIQRRDEVKAPLALNDEPVSKFVSDQAGIKYDSKDLDEYLEFCEFVMRSAPVQGNYCGILLRGTHMFKENAFKILNQYDYNFDLAKFHILYPLVMIDPIKKCQLVQAAKENPDAFAKEVQNAVIDLQGCKKDEINHILDKFRQDLKNRINEDQLKFHLTALKKIRVNTPPDIEEEIRKSFEFSKEIRKKCNMQTGQNKQLSNKASTNISTDKKLKMNELEELYEEQKKYCYITQEMIMLEQQLEKAKQWKQRAESLRDKEYVHYKTIEHVYQDGKNIPVNFQELMAEIKQRKVKAENLNSRIQDAIVVKKTRTRPPENAKRSSRKVDNQFSQDQAHNNDFVDKEAELRALNEEAKQLQLQSEQISKLQQKLNDIDKWKQEVISIFRNQTEEANNYQRYQQHYRSLIARSTQFQIELKLMKHISRKCSFINWRDKIEEIHSKLEREERMTIEQLLILLKDGVEKGFLEKQSEDVFIPLKQADNEVDTLMENDENEIDFENSARDPIEHMYAAFDSLNKVIQIFDQAIRFDKNLKRAIKYIENTQSNSSSQTSLHGESQIQSDQVEFDTFEKLNELLAQEKNIKIEVTNLKEFKNKLKELSKAEKECNDLIEKYLDKQTGEFILTDKKDMDTLVKAMGEFESQNITCTAFKMFNEKMLPYIFWFNKATKLIKNYNRAIGVKSSSLNCIDCVDLKPENSPYKDLQSSFDILIALDRQLSLDQFKFLEKTDEGKFIQQILSKTQALKQQFHEMQELKRNDDFDLQKYFKLLEQIQNSGLPEETAVIEEARIELKREKWIKKFNDLQNSGKQQILQVQETEPPQVQNSQQSVVITPEKQGQSHIRIKTVDSLVKDYQANSELNQHLECQQYYEKLVKQQVSCQKWLDKFNSCFNALGQFEPKGGQSMINTLIQEGKNLELKLKEFVDLQVHQKETTEWNNQTEQIFNNSKTVNLDQLVKHIKDTKEITDNSCRPLIDVLESLKETTTYWKIFANTILKIRPIENIIQIVEQSQQIETSPSQRELFCICRQPENGSLMLCCDFCDMWYHYTCIGLHNKLKLDKIKYKCIGCLIREGKFNPVTGTIENDLLMQGETPESSVDPHQQEIETVLLDLFISKQRMSEEHFTFIIEEGRNRIPLLLEEMKQLEFLENSMKQWKALAQQQINQGTQIRELISNFKRINSSLFEKTGSMKQVAIGSSEDQNTIRDIQLKEKERDEQLHILIIQSQSFPVIMPEEMQLISNLRFRDWFRQSISLYMQQTLKTVKPNKASKQKMQKALKKLIQTGDKLLNDIQMLQTDQMEQSLANEANSLLSFTMKSLDIMKLLNKNKGLGPNNLEAFERLVKVDTPVQKTAMLVSISLDSESPKVRNEKLELASEFKTQQIDQQQYEKFMVVPQSQSISQFKQMTFENDGDSKMINAKQQSDEEMTNTNAQNIIIENIPGNQNPK